MALRDFSQSSVWGYPRHAPRSYHPTLYEVISYSKGLYTVSKDVLVIGGGIAGIQGALDLADMGVQVHLVEKTPSLGGRMAQLDKTFPTNDCSICILSPKMADCFGHPNIHTLTYSEVSQVEGKAGAFTVKVLKKARYVKEDECTGCGECMAKCPVTVPDEFDMKLRNRKGIYLYFAQGVPRVVTIDPEHCLKITRDRCGLCARTCQRDAIDYTQRDEEVVLNVGAIIVATGFELYDVSHITQYGYGKYKNVVTSLEYERLICANGPTGGHLERPSDGGPVKEIGYIQCVGSRNVRMNRYCSAVCCMHATKEAMLAKEHDDEVHSYIFYTDLRAIGKGFREYIERARTEYNVTYIRGRIAEITENAAGKPVVSYEDTEAGQVHRMPVDLAVLGASLVPSRGVEEVADLLGVELDAYRFFKTDPFSPTDTTRPGIFVCGYCAGPMDIPESVTQASAAAARAAEIVFKGNGR